MPDAEYTQRARRALSAGDPISAVALDLGTSARAVEGRVIAGWWCAPGTPGVEVLPNPWDDRALLAEYDRRAWSLAASTVTSLGRRLNSIHGLDHGDEYWDVLLAPWALIMAAVVLDRRLYLATTAELAPGVPVLARAGGLAPEPSMIASVSACRSERFNEALMAQLAERFGLPAQVLPARPLDGGPASANGSVVTSRLAHVGANASSLVQRALAHSLAAGFRGRRLALVGLHSLSLRQLLALRRAVPGVRVAPRRIAPGLHRVDLGGSYGAHPGRSRLGAAGAQGGDEQSLLEGLLPDLVPRSLVEGYAAVVEASRRTYGPPAHVLHGNYSYDELANEFAARAVAAGLRLGFSQHGGCADTLELAPAERLELRPGSVRLSWGRAKGARGVPNPYVQRLAGTHRGGDRVVLVEALAPPDTYVMRFTSVPLGNQVLLEQERQLRFVELLGPRTRPVTVLKRFPGADAASARPPALSRLPVPRRLAHRPAVEWMRRARVVVVTYPDTPFIEAMALGAPVIGLWSRRLWGMRDDARAIFDALAELGVVHDDPKAAAELLEDVYPMAESWWGSPEIRAAREAFLERFALVGDWLGPWADAARELTRG